MSGHVELWTLAELIFDFQSLFFSFSLCSFYPGRHVPVPYFSQFGVESGELNLYATNGACSGFFSKTFPPKPKKGPNLFFEVQNVGLTKAYLRIATGVLEMPKQP